MNSQVGRTSLNSDSLLSILTCLIIPSSVPDLYWKCFDRLGSAVEFDI